VKPRASTGLAQLPTYLLCSYRVLSYRITPPLLCGGTLTALKCIISTIVGVLVLDYLVTTYVDVRLIVNGPGPVCKQSHLPCNLALTLPSM
jgi:hypothetical protein